MFERILVLCTGNICRSPVAAAMLAARLPDKRIESAGLGAMEGQGVEPKARALAEADPTKIAADTSRFRARFRRLSHIRA